MRRGVIGSAATVLAAITVAAAVVQPAAAGGQSQTHSRDRRATYAYLQIRYRLARTLLAHRGASRRALASLVVEVGERCPGALTRAPAGRQLLGVEAEILTNGIEAPMRPNREAMRHAARAMDRLHWSDRKRARSVHIFAGLIRAYAHFHAGDLCSDIGAWVASGYRRLAPGTLASVRFVRHVTMAVGQLGEVPGRYQGSRARRLARQTGRLERRLSAGLNIEPEIERVGRELGLHGSARGHAGTLPHG